MVSLTGDVATGQKILSAAAGNLKRTHLELGGKAPVIVFDDADLDAVVAGVRTFGFYNAGQDCTAACRLYAGAKIYDRLVADLGAAVRSLKVGSQERGRRGDGPADLRRTAHPRGGIRRARGGAAGTSKSPPAERCARAPGSSTSRRSSRAPASPMRSCSAKSSGPVVSVTRFTDADDAVAWANDSEYGLASSVWTQDVGKAMRVAARLQYGCTWINTHFMLISEMPHGGFKRSGYGKDLSVYALEDYSVPRHIMVKL